MSVFVPRVDFCQEPLKMRDQFLRVPDDSLVLLDHASGGSHAPGASRNSRSLSGKFDATTFTRQHGFCQADGKNVILRPKFLTPFAPAHFLASRLIAA